METKHARDAERSTRILALLISAAIAGMASAFAAFLSVLACVGTDGEGVALDSIRGQACDVPALGPWPYASAVAVVGVLIAARRMLKHRPTGWRMALTVVAPAILVLTVPVVLHSLPR